MNRPEKWVAAGFDEKLAAGLSASLRISSLLSKCLLVRGLSDTDSARKFLYSSLSMIPLPELLPGIKIAGDRILRAIGSGEFITVFGDFDTDGITASAIIHGIIKKLGGKSGVFIPDRKLEGYGFSIKALDRCLKVFPETSLIVTVDCGITHAATCAEAVSRGVSVIVTDHHEPDNDFPNTAEAVVDPHLPGTPPEMAFLCGAGVAFTLAHRLARAIKNENERLAAIKLLLQPAAIGTLADLVPLTGENRHIVKHGLRLIDSGKCPGITELKRVAGIRGELTSEKVSFAITPRINASGRIGNPAVALALIEGCSAETNEVLASMLDDFNRIRRELERTAVRQAMETVGSELEKHPDAVAVFSADWHPGILGLVATRISQRFDIPVVALCEERDGVLRGSARCPDNAGFDMLAILSECAGCLEEFGGHRIAAGLSLKKEKLNKFRDLFDNAAKNGRIKPEEKIVRFDLEITPADISTEICAELKMLEPFGMGNAAPLFLIRNLTLSSDPSELKRCAGAWTMSFVETDVTGIMFRSAAGPDCKKGDHTDILAALGTDIFACPQLIVSAVRPAETPPLPA